MARDFAPRPGLSPHAPNRVSEPQAAPRLPAPPSAAAGDLTAQVRNGHSLERIPLRAERPGAPGAAARTTGQPWLHALKRHNPTPGDGRSYAEKKADVTAAVDEAQVHVDHPGSTVASVEQALPGIQERYGLRSLELQSRGESSHAVVGKLNPTGEGEEVDLPMGGFGMDSDEESEPDDAHHAAPAQANRPMTALEMQKAEEARLARERRAKKAERSQREADRERAAREQQRIEDAKPRKHHYVYPSEMTGDIWHAAAAMILDPTAQVHFTSPRDTQTGEYEQHMHDLNDEDRATIEQRTAEHPAPSDPHANPVGAAVENDAEIRKLQQNIHSRERNIAHIPKDRAKWIKNRASNEKTLADLGVGGRSHHELVPGSYRTSNVEAHGRRQLEETLANDPRVKHVVHSQKETTRAIMNAVGPDGANKDQVVARLRAGMTGHADAHEKRWVSKRIKAIRARVKKLRKESGKEDARLLMINRRKGHENPQHNTSDEQFQAITSLYGREHLGEENAEAHRLSTMGVATGAEPQPGDLDLYDMRAAPGKAPPATKRRTALLWARIADLQKEGLVHGLIGGRSGSMDIASFMGVNAYSWDENKPDNVDHQRLLMTAPSMMTVGHMSSDDNHALNEEQIGAWINKPHAPPVRPPGHEQVPPEQALRTKIRGLDTAIRQMTTGLQRAPKKKKAALRQQLKAARQKRSRLQNQLRGLKG